MSPPIKTLLFSTLFPSAVRPVHGIFVETRLRELLKTGKVETKVVAPVPWFPLKGDCFGDYGKFAATAHTETRNGVDVFHPRYFLPPKIGMNIAPYTLARGALPTIKKIIREGFDFDLIDAHYYFPDGIAAGFIAKTLGKPFVVTARGTDLNLIPQYPFPRKLIIQTATAANASIGVCQALMDSLAKLGADPVKMNVFRNGVDLYRFRPEESISARHRLNLPADQIIMLSVGHLVERKGHHIAIEALCGMQPNTMLVIAGTGPERSNLEQQAKRLGLTNRVLFTGPVENSELRWWYSAADVLTLCSSREGWANVLLEAMACGTPVIATNLWGTPEVVTTPLVGQLMQSRTPTALCEAYSVLMNNYPDRMAIRQYAERYSWDETTNRQIELFQRIVDLEART